MAQINASELNAPTTESKAAAPHAATPTQDTVASQATRSPFLSEDWLAVWIGVILITAVLVLAPWFSSIGFKIPSYGWASGQDLVGKVLAANNLLLMVELGLILFVLAALAVFVWGGKVRRFAAGFAVVYLLAIVALIIAGNSTLALYGIEYVIFALVFGLAIGNLVVLPDWLRQAARSEFYIKTGLVVLGTSVLFGDILQAGLPGILQALVVVTVVWFFSFWLARRLKVDDEFAVMLSTAVSICGVSAAIAAGGAIQGDRKKLSYVTTIVVLLAVPMLIVMPWIVKTAGVGELVGGAWLGGTLDTTASVTAAAQLVGPIATKTGVIVKFSQNVLIGVAALLLAIWWTARKNPKSKRPEARVIWERFPKFVLGFIAVSLLFSFFIAPGTIKQVSPLLNGLRTLWFALAFVAIGLEARFVDLVKLDNGRPALAFVGAQVFNIIWTLLIAYLLFGGVLLPVPDIK